LRRCQPSEIGAVLSRYDGIAGYDWIAIPLVPYLYSVEHGSGIPERASHEAVSRLRNNYHEAHLLSLGDDVPEGNIVHGGWKELVGVAYERRIYAFRFDTTEAQDDALIARMNAAENRPKFHLLFNNCADFARVTLNYYFPGKFKRSIFPDAGMTTPKQIAYKLVRYGKKHPAVGVAVYEIPQIPGNRRPSGKNKDIAESLVTSVYAIPIAVVNPYLAGALLVDYLVRGHHHLVPKDPPQLGPEDLAVLTYSTGTNQAVDSASELPVSQMSGDTEPPSAATPIPMEKETLFQHE
jgi:hypothetical protein